MAELEQNKTKADNRARIRADVPVTIRDGIKARFVSFHDLSDPLEHVALVFGDAQTQNLPLVRLHSQCLTGDLFGSFRCDCGDQLNEAIDLMAVQGGVLLYLIQEGRGIGLYNKLDAYKLQIEQGMDTYEANRHIGQPLDARNYTVAYEMLDALGVNKIKLLSNNPDKAAQLKALGIDVAETIATQVHVTHDNLHYLQAKQEKTGHHILFEDGALLTPLKDDK